LGCFILFVNDEPTLSTENVNIILCENKEPEDGMWKIYFDGASS
jgi:hypothetical protein